MKHSYEHISPRDQWSILIVIPSICDESVLLSFYCRSATHVFLKLDRGAHHLDRDVRLTTWEYADASRSNCACAFRWDLFQFEEITLSLLLLFFNLKINVHLCLTEISQTAGEEYFLKRRWLWDYRTKSILEPYVNNHMEGLEKLVFSLRWINKDDFKKGLRNQIKC